VCGLDLKVLLMTHRWHSACESEEKYYTFSRKMSVGSTSVIPRRNKPPEQSANKEYLISFQRSLKLLGIQPKDFGINSEINTYNSHTSALRYIMNKSNYWYMLLFSAGMYLF
jgi:hypothetical protein